MPVHGFARPWSNRNSLNLLTEPYSQAPFCSRLKEFRLRRFPVWRCPSPPKLECWLLLMTIVPLPFKIHVLSVIGQSLIYLPIFFTLAAGILLKTFT
jgi:hypothetical protein